MKISPPLQFSKATLDELYKRYNRREYIHPDPLQFLYDYKELPDREIVGLVASSLAYGRVAQILKSVSAVLDVMGPHPSAFVLESSSKSLGLALGDFKHRFTTGEHLAGFLLGIKKALKRYGSLEACFLAGMNREETTVLPALTAFVRELSGGTACLGDMFLPLPTRGSACKRLNLFLRWMVRCDDVDPGGWSGVSPSRLIVPLDTHMHRIGRMLGLTCRKQADMKAALEITDAFRSLVPADPVRYDFVLTRLGIRKDLNL